MADPWDDLGAESDPRHPAMLIRLAADFRASGFDVKATAAATGAVAGLRSRRPPAGSRRPVRLRAFAAARVRPLAPGQLFRTLITATGADDIVRHRQRRGRSGTREGKIAPTACWPRD